MKIINIKRFGAAWGITSSLLYLGCVFVMWTVGKDGSILFFNSLMHGIDVTSIIRTDMPWWEMVIGLAECRNTPGIHHCPLRRNVRLSTDHIPAY